jgi:hypothetical protein
MVELLGEAFCMIEACVRESQFATSAIEVPSYVARHGSSAADFYHKSGERFSFFLQVPASTRRWREGKT